MVNFIWQHNVPVGLMAVSKCLPEGYSKGKKWAPPPPPSLTLVTPKLKVKELSQSGFWNISSHPTSVPSFSQIGWPQLLAPGTLSQTISTNINHKGLQRTANEYAEERRIYKEFADQVFIDPTFFGIFVCGPLQSFVVNVFTLRILGP